MEGIDGDGGFEGGFGRSRGGGERKREFHSSRTTKYLPPELHEITTESDSDSDWDDSEEDPDFHLLEETHSKFSNLSLKHKAKAGLISWQFGVCIVFEDKDLGEEVNASAHDGDTFEEVQKLIQLGRLEKLKVDECKLYPRKNGLRLTGNKDTLIQRIKKHLEILNGGVKKYPPSSFVLNCKGDACTGDVVLFEQNVYEMLALDIPKLDFPASGPPCGKRIGAGHIVQESYGATKQQHTFPIWEDESQRQKILMEKHSRGSLAREDREARIQEKEKRKKTKENRISKKDSVRNQSHSQITRPQYQPQKTNKHSSIVNKPAAVTGRHGDSKTLGRASFTVHNMHNQQAWNRTGDCRNISDIGHMRRGADLSVCYNYADPHFRDKPTIIQKYHPFMDETSGFTVGTHLHHRMPLANANHSQPVMPNRESYNKQKQVCRHYARGKCYFGDNCKFLHDLRDKRECSLLCNSQWFM
ncbi:hypothetical protein AAZX31_07G040500 [Glycine max]